MDMIRMLIFLTLMAITNLAISATISLNQYCYSADGDSTMFDLYSGDKLPCGLNVGSIVNSYTLRVSNMSNG